MKRLNNLSVLIRTRLLPAASLAVFLISAVPLASGLCAGEKGPESWMEMSLAELQQIRVANVGSLTETVRGKIPAAVTRIDQNEIQSLGARSLLELLEMTVPGIQVIRHHWELPHIGIRGITSDREDKVMIRVNGRVMNERTKRGAITERDFPIMGDIMHIDVIRGAGSSMYGLGAVSTVIDITTFSAALSPENSVAVRGGLGLPFYAFDTHFSKQFNNGLGLYFHGEVADVKGADDGDAPLIFAADGVSTKSGELVRRGDPFPTISRDGEGFKGEPFVKAHLDMNYKDTRFWLRYTKAGRDTASAFGYITESSPKRGSQEELLSQIGYEQLTATLEQTHQLPRNMDLNWMFSYDRTDVTKIQPVATAAVDDYSEDEVFAKLVANFNAGSNSDVAVGAEFSFEKFDFRSSNHFTWNTQTKSLVGEWQWRPHPYWTTFIGGRMDKNTYTDLLYSPRAAVVYSNDDINIYKLMLTQSQRMNIAADGNRADRSGGEFSDPELLKSVELRYERALNTSFFGLSLFYIDLDVIGWDQTLRRSKTVGNQTQWGAELELDLKYGAHRIRFSQAYTKLIDFELYGKNTFITAEPFGYGDDLADWGTHTSKLWYTYQINDQTKFTTTLRAIWDFDGSQDYGEKRIDDGQTIVSPGWEKGYGEQLYLNFGIQYKPSREKTFTLHIHNALGIMDKDLNKRAYRDSQGDYRSEAVAVSAGFKISF